MYMYSVKDRVLCSSKYEGFEAASSCPCVEYLSSIYLAKSPVRTANQSSPQAILGRVGIDACMLIPSTASRPKSDHKVELRPAHSVDV
jgi:hypothetical protein